MATSPVQQEMGSAWPDDSGTYKTSLYEKSVDSELGFAVYYPTEATRFPVVLFQSGYGSTNVSHEYFARQVASEGFVVVIPKRAGDQRCGCVGAWGLFFGCPCSALSTSGNYLLKALEFVEAEAAAGAESAISDRMDLTKIASAGFSMGGYESVNFATGAAKEKVKSLAVLSGSFVLIAAAGFQQCPCTVRNKASTLTIPSLWVVGNGDLMNTSNKKMFDRAGGDKHFFTIAKEAMGDPKVPYTKKHGTWWTFLWWPLGPFIGLNQHFAIAHEVQNPSAPILTSFLKQTFSDEPPSGDALSKKFAQTIPQSLAVEHHKPSCCFWQCLWA